MVVITKITDSAGTMWRVTKDGRFVGWSNQEHLAEDIAASVREEA